MYINYKLLQIINLKPISVLFEIDFCFLKAVKKQQNYVRDQNKVGVQNRFKKRYYNFICHDLVDCYIDSV